MLGVLIYTLISPKNILTETTGIMFGQKSEHPVVRAGGHTALIAPEGGAHRVWPSR